MIVVDTNILTYHCLPGSRNADTEALLKLEPEWTAPLLWRSEFRNLLCGYLRRGDLNAEQAREVMLVATANLKGGEYAVSDDAVLTLVSQSRCSAYDCEFAALAQSLHCPLVTEDKALLSAFPTICQSLKRILRASH